mmetsp:Transcript_3953/g.7991  ORF Transcript_3953/g.7991 Transcript_3953/m.7991 type:complete len:363 (+) Transcript_3953:218-1306(+)
MLCQPVLPQANLSSMLLPLLADGRRDGRVRVHNNLGRLLAVGREGLRHVRVRLVLDSGEHDLVPVRGGLVHVPVVANVGDGSARAGETAGGVPPAVPGDSLDGGLSVLLADALAELDHEHRGRLGSHVQHGGARRERAEVHRGHRGVVLEEGVRGELVLPGKVIIDELLEGARGIVPVTGALEDSSGGHRLDVVPEIAVDEFDGHERTTREDHVVSVRHIVAEPLCNVGVGVPDRHVVLHRRHKHGSAASLRQIPEGLRIIVEEEVGVPVLSASKSSKLHQVPEVVARMAEALVGRLAPVHPEICRGRPWLRGRLHLEEHQVLSQELRWHILLGCHESEACDDCEDRQRSCCDSTIKHNWTT